MSTEFPGNSHSDKRPAAPAPAKPKVVTLLDDNQAVVRKRPLGRKFMETFFGSSAKELADHVVWDVAIPNAKFGLFEIVTQGFEYMLFGESRPGQTRRPGGIIGNMFGNATYQPYNQMSQQKPVGYREDPRNAISRRARSTHDFGEIVVPTKAHADAIIGQMYEILERYEVVTLSAFYEICNIKALHTDEQFGWTDLSGSRAHRVRNGYVLDIPRPVKLD